MSSVSGQETEDMITFNGMGLKIMKRSENSKLTIENDEVQSAKIS